MPGLLAAGDPAKKQATGESGAAVVTDEICFRGSSWDSFRSWFIYDETKPAENGTLSGLYK